MFLTERLRPLASPELQNLGKKIEHRRKKTHFERSLLITS